MLRVGRPTHRPAPRRDRTHRSNNLPAKYFQPIRRLALPFSPRNVRVPPNTQHPTPNAAAPSSGVLFMLLVFINL